ncbi:MAG TPA: phosphotransferase, partial [Nannocystis sp.]
MTPPPELRALAVEVHGDDMSSWTCLKENASSTVWQTGALVIKHHRHPRAFAQELRAYQEWLPQLDLPHARTPRLLAVDLDARALALTRLPGLHLSPGTSSMHTAAGRFARALHTLAVVDDDPIPLADAIGARLDAWHDRARGLLTPAERGALARLAAGRDAFVGVARVPCHRDFTPDNWL